MRFVSRKRSRNVLIALYIISVVWFISRSVVRFQLNEQVKFYRNYFNTYRDELKREYNPLEIKQITEKAIDALYAHKLQRVADGADKEIEWNKFAYVSYATDSSYLCNTLILFSSLIKEFRTKAKLVLLVGADTQDSDINVLEKIQNLSEEQVIIKRIETFETRDKSDWEKSLTKLHIFNQTEFDRIVYLDSDSLLRSNLDELFFLPDYIKFAAPLTYWELHPKDLQNSYKEVKSMRNPINIENYNRRIINRIGKGKMIYNHLPNLPHNLYLNSKDIGDDILKTRTIFSISSWFNSGPKPSKVKFASTLMVIKPSNETFATIKDYYVPLAQNSKNIYDMDLINNYVYNLRQLIYDHFTVLRSLKAQFVPEVLVLPFTRYGLLTGSLRDTKQIEIMQDGGALGYKNKNDHGKDIKLSLDSIISNAGYVHFSDYPQPKPWYLKDKTDLQCQIKRSRGSKIEEDDSQICSVWQSFYDTYLDKSSICK